MPVVRDPITGAWIDTGASNTPVPLDTGLIPLQPHYGNSTSIIDQPGGMNFLAQILESYQNDQALNRPRPGTGVAQGATGGGGGGVGSFMGNLWNSYQNDVMSRPVGGMSQQDWSTYDPAQTAALLAQSGRTGSNYSGTGAPPPPGMTGPTFPAGTQPMAGGGAPAYAGGGSPYAGGASPYTTSGFQYNPRGGADPYLRGGPANRAGGGGGGGGGNAPAAAPPDPWAGYDRDSTGKPIIRPGAEFPGGQRNMDTFWSINSSGQKVDSNGNPVWGEMGTGPTQEEMTAQFNTLKTAGLVFWPGSYSTWWSAGKPLASDMSDYEKQILSQGGDWNDVQTYRMVTQGPGGGGGGGGGGTTPPPAPPVFAGGALPPPPLSPPGVPGIIKPPQMLPGGLEALQDPAKWHGYDPDRLIKNYDPRDLDFSRLPAARQALLRAHRNAGYPQGGGTGTPPPAGGGTGTPQPKPQVPPTGQVPPPPVGQTGGAINTMSAQGTGGGIDKMYAGGSPNLYNPMQPGSYEYPYHAQPGYGANMTPEEYQEFLAWQSGVALPWTNYARGAYVDDRNFGEDVRRDNRNFDYTAGVDTRNFGEDVRRYDQGFGEDVRRYDQGFGEDMFRDRRNFGEDTRRFDETLDWTKTADAMRSFGARQMPNVRQMSFR